MIRGLVLLGFVSLFVGQPSEASESLKSGYHAASVWVKLPNTKSWTQSALSIIEYRRTDLDRATDIEEFCPGYRQASLAQQRVCWIRLIGAVANFESGMNPKDTYLEPGFGPSTGLLGLSVHECSVSPNDLQDARLNIECGLNLLADLIKMDGVISGPEGVPHAKLGAAGRWSSLRKPHVVDEIVVGRRDEVIAITRDYKRY